MPSDFMPRSKKNKSSSSKLSSSPSSSSSTLRKDAEEVTIEEEEEGYEVDNRRKKSRRGESSGTPQLQSLGDKIPPHLLAQMKQAQPTFVGTLDIDSLDSTRDLWIIDCPKNVDLGSLFEGHKIRLDGTPTLLSSSIVEEGSEELCYEARARLLTNDTSEGEGEDGIMLLGPDGHSQFTIASAPLAGYISITQSLQEEEESAPIIKKNKKRKRHKLPPGIKIRHPQYGVLDPSQSFSKVTKTSKKRKKNQSRVHTYY